MSDNKTWSSITVLQDPLRVVFTYETGDIKSVTAPKEVQLHDIHQAEWDNIALNTGEKTLGNRQPLLTTEEMLAAKSAIRDHGFRIL